MNEEWKDVVGWEGLYKISNKGRLLRLIGGRERLKSPKKNRLGYYVAMLYSKPNTKCVPIHRLVAMAFLPNPDNKPCIDHINTKRDDNRVENLRWVTYKENSNNPLTLEHLAEANIGYKNPAYGKTRSMESRRKQSKTVSGENNHFFGKTHTDESRKKIAEATRARMSCDKNPFMKPVLQFTKDGQFVKEWDCAKRAENELGISHHIHDCCKGKLKTTGGYIWKYKNLNK